MITRDEFPYLQELIINDAYAVKNLRVPVFEVGKPFKHLILTGRNGSGKTTILRELKYAIDFETIGTRLISEQRQLVGVHSLKLKSQEEIDKLQVVKVETHYSALNKTQYKGFFEIKNRIVDILFEASRNFQLNPVETIISEDALETQLMKNSGKLSIEFFKQYLVNKKVFQVFNILDGKNKESSQQENFFNKLKEILIKIFEDNRLELEFVREKFEFYIKLSNGQYFTFNQLSAGFSAFLSILTELLMRTDLLRKQANDYTYDPCGFVLIDEPETHLHLEMQYQILPLLTELFPNLQFIVATHSPAVASSIKNATVFDLSTGEAMGDEAAGSSFSELMQTHFGVENEYSNVADEILADIKRITKLPDHEQARQQLLSLLAEKGRYMSAGLRLEVEAQLIGLE